MSLYRDLLKKTKEAIADAQVPFKVKKEQKQLELKIIELESEIAKNELTIEEQKSANPINWDKLINAINERDLNNRKLTQLKALSTELFD